MNRLVDCSMIMNSDHKFKADVTPSLVELTIRSRQFQATAYEISHHSLCGTYIDFPGHIVQTDDGMDSACYPVERLFRLRSAVIHLDRADKPGPVTAAELQSASPGTSGCGALVINALGIRRFDEITDGSIWLDDDAAKWIIDSGVHIVMSDVYKRLPELNTVFSDLFAARISTVCDPVNLHRLTDPHVLLTVMPMSFQKVNQIPCRVIAELKNRETEKNEKQK